MTEGRVAMRRRHVAAVMAGMGDVIRRRLVSPGALVTAAYVGVVLDRSSRVLNWKLMMILGAGRAGIRYLFTRIPALHSTSESPRPETIDDG